MGHRQLQGVAAVALLLAGAACTKKGDDPAAVRAVCKTRAATQSAVDSTAPIATSQYPKVIAGLASAAKVAPPSIRSDFQTVHDVLAPFVAALVAANGDTEAASNNPAYVKAVHEVGTAKAQEAANAIKAYYAKHCS